MEIKAREAKWTNVLSAGSIKGDRVVNRQGENLGHVEEIMLDLSSGQVAYVVLSFGGFLGLGNKLFPVPWDAFTADLDNQRLILNVEREVLERAGGFDSNNWPDMSMEDWGEVIYSHYGYTPYWRR